MINTKFLYLKYDSAHLLVEQWKIQWHGLGPEALCSCQECRGTWTNLFLLIGSCLLSKRQKDRSLLYHCKNRSAVHDKTTSYYSLFEVKTLEAFAFCKLPPRLPIKHSESVSHLRVLENRPLLYLGQRSSGAARGRLSMGDHKQAMFCLTGVPHLESV